MAARIVVKGNYLVSFLNELAAERRSEEATATRDQDPHAIPNATSSPA
jgi:hypothetical protein